jgi:hypothetical protein
MTYPFDGAPKKLDAAPSDGEKLAALRADAEVALGNAERALRDAVDAFGKTLEAIGELRKLIVEEQLFDF